MSDIRLQWFLCRIMAISLEWPLCIRFGYPTPQTIYPVPPSSFSIFFRVVFLKDNLTILLFYLNCSESLLQDKLHDILGFSWSVTCLHLNFILLFSILWITKSSLDVLFSFSPLYLLTGNTVPTFLKSLFLIIFVKYINSHLSFKIHFKLYILLIFLPQIII